jgi:hypothetical protein
MKTKNYIAGFESGKKHGTPIKGVSNMNAANMYMDNERKAKKVKQDYTATIAVKEYWQGYEDGMVTMGMVIL